MTSKKRALDHFWKNKTWAGEGNFFRTMMSPLGQLTYNQKQMFPVYWFKFGMCLMAEFKMLAEEIGLAMANNNRSNLDLLKIRVH